MGGERLTIAELRDWSAAIFDAVEASGVKHLDVEGRWYWSLPSDQVWGASPPKAEMGDLADDMADIRRNLADDAETRAAYPWHALDHFMGVLTCLSAELKGFRFENRPVEAS